MQKNKQNPRGKVINEIEREITIEPFDIREIEKLLDSPDIDITNITFGGFEPEETKQLNNIIRNLKKEKQPQTVFTRKQL